MTSLCTAHNVICGKNTREKDVVGFVTFDLTGLLTTNHIYIYCLYCNSIPEFVRKRTMLTIKLLKQRKIFEISLSDSRREEMANFGDYPGDFRL